MGHRRCIQHNWDVYRILNDTTGTVEQGVHRIGSVGIGIKQNLRTAAGLITNTLVWYHRNVVGRVNRHSQAVAQANAKLSRRCEPDAIPYVENMDGAHSRIYWRAGSEIERIKLDLVGAHLRIKMRRRCEGRAM